MLNYGPFRSFSLLRKWVIPLMLICALIILWSLYANWPSNEVTISGTVIDVETREPVANAKIIVSVWNVPIWDSNPRCIGFLTDSNGDFQLERTMDFMIGWINFEVCTPKNKYIYYDSVPNEMNQIIEVGGQKPKEQTRPSYQEYDNFSSGCWGKEVVFE